jgi:hypothetical protein
VSALPLRPLRLLTLAPREVFAGLEHCLGARWRALALIGLGLAFGWWVYVPLHELLHAAACWVSGGTVTRLEIDRLYLGALLARFLPFVRAGSEYAGRLSGFDPHGSDAVRLATDFGPFLLTLWPGVWWLRRAARASRPFLFGAALPWALAPFLSLTGDMYEIGALLVTQLPPWAAAVVATQLRGDDLSLRLTGLAALPQGAPWGGAALAAFVGLCCALALYGAGSLSARLLGQRPLS